MNNHAHILRALPQYVDTEFLHRALRHYNFMSYISGTTRAKLTQGQLNSAKLIVPPLGLQVNFSRRVSSVGMLNVVAADSFANFDSLFTCLQHRAFRGEL